MQKMKRMKRMARKIKKEKQKTKTVALATCQANLDAAKNFWKKNFHL